MAGHTQSARWLPPSVYMRAGSYPIRIEWFNQRRHAIVQLKWRSADLGLAKQVVPSSALRPADPAAPSPPTVSDGLNMTAYWSGAVPSGFGNYATLAPYLKIQKLAPKVGAQAPAAAARRRRGVAAARQRGLGAAPTASRMPSRSWTAGPSLAASTPTTPTCGPASRVTSTSRQTAPTPSS